MPVARRRPAPGVPVARRRSARATPRAPVPTLRRRTVAWAAATLAVLAVASCAGGPAAEPEPLRVLVTGLVSVPGGVLDGFEEATGRTVHLVTQDGPTRAVEDLLAAPDRPIADVIVGVPDTLDLPLSEVISTGPALAEDDIAPSAGLGPDSPGVPVAVVDHCLVVDDAALEARGVAAPRQLTDALAGAAQAGLVVADPATTVEGARFLDLLRSAYPAGSDADDWVDVATGLLRSGLVVAPSWRASIDEAFVGLGHPDGPAMVWGAASLPALLVAYDDPVPDETSVRVVRDSCVRTVLIAGVVSNSASPGAAAQLISWLRRADVQGRLIDERGTMPVRLDAELPEAFARHAHLPRQPVRPPGTDERTASEGADPASVWRALVERAAGADTTG